MFNALSQHLLTMLDQYIVSILAFFRPCNPTAHLFPKSTCQFLLQSLAGGIVIHRYDVRPALLHSVDAWLVKELKLRRVVL